MLCLFGLPRKPALFQKESRKNGSGGEGGGWEEEGLGEMEER